MQFLLFFLLLFALPFVPQPHSSHIFFFRFLVVVFCFRFSPLSDSLSRHSWASVCGACERIESEKIDKCHYCLSSFTETNNKVLDHNHFTGKFNCVSCSRCNLFFVRKLRYLPIFFNNLKGYDMHLLCKYGFQKMSEWSFNVIA